LLATRYQNVQVPNPRPTARPWARKRGQLILAIQVALIGLVVFTIPAGSKELVEIAHIDKQAYENVEAMSLDGMPNTLQEKSQIPVASTEKVQLPSGSHQDWMTAAGIQPSDFGYVDYIVSHESGWNPCAFNPGKSDCNATPTTACGLVQALPCSKLGKDWQNPVNALKWGDTYAKARYGGWAKAYAFWVAKHWW
jgi:hypothetical protein